MLKVVGGLLLFSAKVNRRFKSLIFRRLFFRCGTNVVFDPGTSYFTYSSISIGSNIFIGGRAWWSAGATKIIIGNYVMFGPSVTILGGDHASGRIDIPMFLQKKDKFDVNLDADIVIEDDVWVGAGVTILKGVVIHKGSIVAAGSLVNKSVPAYSVVAGVPAKIIKSRLS